MESGGIVRNGQANTQAQTINSATPCLLPGASDGIRWNLGSLSSPALPALLPVAILASLL